MIEKLINEYTVVIGLIGGYVGYLVGGFDVMIQSLTLLIVFDFVTGLLKAISNKNISGELMYNGIIKKVFIFVVIAVSVVSQNFTGDNLPIREITITFFVVNEALSILENSATFVPIPDDLKKLFINLRKEDDDL